MGRVRHSLEYFLHTNNERYRVISDIGLEKLEWYRLEWRRADMNKISHKKYLECKILLSKVFEISDTRYFCKWYLKY